MTPAQAAVEAEKAAVAFQVALAKIGAATIIEALRLWKRVPANKAAEVSEEWLKDAVFLVMERRSFSRQLAVAYYRLARALRTGTTVPDPDDPTLTTVTLKDLRVEFDLLIRSVDQPSETPSKAPEGTSPGGDTKDDGTTFTGDSVVDAPQTPDDSREWDKSKDEPLPKTIPNVIPIDKYRGWTKGLDDDARQNERNAEIEARSVLETLGTRLLKKKVDAINDDLPAKQVDKLRDQAHSEAGLRAAAAIERLTLNGARSIVDALMARDKRVKGWARVSQTGTPCGFCAMLISRGPVYKSKETAERDGYHDNCHCIAVPMYRWNEYQGDLFALNREYEQLWPKVTKGYSGKDARNAWRRYIRAQQKKQPRRRAQAA